MSEISSESIAQLKAVMPQQRITLIKRPRVLDKFHLVSKFRLSLVIAPPGFGKTRLLTQWVDSMGASDEMVAWYCVDEGDADLQQFLLGLVVSLQRAGVELPQCMRRIESGIEKTGTDALFYLIKKEINQEIRQIYLVLDDYHRATNPDLDKMLQRMIQTFPENIHFILASRKQPNISVPQLIAAGVAAEMGAENLRLTDAESLELLDIEMPAPDRERLIDQMAGWPIALALARFEIRKQLGLKFSLIQFVSRGSHLNRYLAGEVMAALSDEQIEFLLETSILEQFDAILADAVRACTDSWKLMDELYFLQPLMTPVGENGAWFRYQQVFAEYLRNMLHERNPELAMHLHRRASKVLAEQGDLLAAVRHASMARDFDDCVRLIVQAGGWKMVLYGKGCELALMLDYIPIEQRKKYPGMIAADAYLQLRLGDVRAANASLCRLVEPFGQDLDFKRLNAEDRDIFNVKVFLHGYEDNELTLEFLKWGERQLERISSFDELTVGVLKNTLAVTALSVGEFSKAEAFALSAMRAMRHAGSVLSPGYCYLHAGIAALQMGKMRQAASYLTYAQEMIEEDACQGQHLKAMVGVVLGSLQQWRWNLPLQTTACEEVLHCHCEHDGWFDIFVTGVDVLFRHAWMCDDIEMMERALVLGTDIANKYALKRLQLIIDAFTLLKLTTHENRCEARSIALTLINALPLGVWQTQPHLWRPFQEAGFALFRFFLAENAVLNFSIVEDLLRCAIHMQHVPYQIRALLARAVLRDRNGQRRDALADVANAIDLASGHDLQLPFIEQAELNILLKLLQRQLRQTDGPDAIGELFIARILDAHRVLSQERNITATKRLSSRELEVALEIGMGHTNKEIARALGLTVHTVKFHLRNIFVKMGVERRAHVQSLFNDRARQRHYS